MSPASGVVGVGTDLVGIARMRSTLERTPTFVDRVFTSSERAYADQKADPTERYAGRFAAKEAVLKSLGVGLWEFPLDQIEVLRDDSGAPTIVLHDAASELAASRGVRRIEISISHTDDVAVAFAVALAD